MNANTSCWVTNYLQFYDLRFTIYDGESAMLEVIVEGLEIGFAPTLSLTLRVVATRERGTILVVVLDVAAGIGDEPETIGEGVEGKVGNGGIEEILAPIEVAMIDA